MAPRRVTNNKKNPQILVRDYKLKCYRAVFTLVPSIAEICRVLGEDTDYVLALHAPSVCEFVYVNTRDTKRGGIYF